MINKLFRIVISLNSIILFHIILFVVLVCFIITVVIFHLAELLKIGQFFIPSIAIVLGVIAALITSLRNVHILDQEHQKHEFEIKKHQWEKDIKTNILDRIAQEKSTKDGIVLDICQDISHYLGEHPKWAVKAMRNAPHYPYKNTTFAHRTIHYEQEKEIIGNYFSKFLIQRLQDIIKQGNKERIYILIDSGTTLVPLMENLSRQFATIREDDLNALIKHVRIITNNMAGVESYLFPDGKEQEHVPIHIAPGRPVARYRAITMPKDAKKRYTEKYISELIKDAKSKEDGFGPEKVYIISLVTGNWIGLRKAQNDQKIIPRPFARGEGHKEFKSLLCDKSDELYVVSPLAKLIWQKSYENVQSFNEELDLLDRYDEVNEDCLTSNSKRTYLITTYRTNRLSILSKFTGRIQTLLNLYEFNYEDGLTSSDKILESFGGIMFPYDTETDIYTENLRIEFPHSYTHEPDFLRKFYVEKTSQ